MNKDIRTHESKLNLIKKFLDYVYFDNASYAMLYYIQENTKYDKKQ